MGKFLAIVFLILFVWLAIPRIIRGQWIAPTAVMPNSWESVDASRNGLADAGQPTEGFGWFHFDFWNHPSTAGTPATTNDLHFRGTRTEFH